MPKKKRRLKRENELLRELVESYREQMAVRRELDKHRIEYINRQQHH